MQPCAQWAYFASTARITRVGEHCTQQDSHKLSHSSFRVSRDLIPTPLGEPPARCVRCATCLLSWDGPASAAAEVITLLSN
jgi:hypothetical protein